MPTPKSAPSVKTASLRDQSGTTLEDITDSVAIEITSTGRLSVFGAGRQPYDPSFGSLVLQKLSDAASNHLIRIQVSVDAAAPGSSFVHIQPRSWYPSCDFTKTFWMGDAISAPSSLIYAQYGPADLGDEDRLEDDPGRNPNELTLELAANGTLTVRTFHSTFVQHMGAGNPNTGNPDKYAIIFGVFGNAALNVNLTGLAEKAPDFLKKPIVVKSTNRLLAKKIMPKQKNR